MDLSNPRRFIEATGGELDIVARFRGGSVKIGNFGEIGGQRFAARNVHYRKSPRSGLSKVPFGVENGPNADDYDVDV